MAKPFQHQRISGLEGVILDLALAVHRSELVIAPGHFVVSDHAVVMGDHALVIGNHASPSRITIA